MGEPKKNKVQLDAFFIAEEVINESQLHEVLMHQKEHGGRIENALLKLKFIDEKRLGKILEKYYGVPSVDLSNFKIEKNVLGMINQEICEKYTVLPISKVGNTLVVAFADPSNIYVRDDLAFLTKCKIQVVVSPEALITSAIDKYYSANRFEDPFNKLPSKDKKNKENREDEYEDLNLSQVENIGDKRKEDGPIVEFVNILLGEAIKKKVSDIHIEPYEKNFRIRYRLDGGLVETTKPPVSAASAVASRLKVMAKLDIAEKRRPQDGRIKVRTPSGQEIDFRVSVLPTLFGEKIVLRLLDKTNLQLDMTKLGFEEDDLKKFKEIVHYPTGMILITGPTGSGKTTTIYSALSELNQPGVNICTAEDPVEFNLEGINQVQINQEIDLTFANALRSFLRQDPDIVMVGEIRDLETAEIAAKAASTGHLVVSTLHTNDAPSTVSRLLDMGIAPYVVTSTVNLIVAQRLVRKVCQNCKERINVKPEVLLDLGILKEEIDEYDLHKGKGCGYCNETGISGRLAIYEVMVMTPNIQEKIISGISTGQLREIARKEGMRTLRRSALLKLKKGLTTIEEVVNSSIKDY